jgi:hypothetical protein
MPTGLKAEIVTEDSVVISWQYENGLTYHVYRRSTASDGSLFRVDDTTGSLSNRGLADSTFSDTTVDPADQYEYMIIAEDEFGNLSPHSAILEAIAPEYVCGDIDGNQSVNVSDIVTLISYVFADGPPPDPPAAGDVDCSGTINVADVVTLISYIFAEDTLPCDPDADGVPDC